MCTLTLRDCRQRASSRKRFSFAKQTAQRTFFALGLLCLPAASQAEDVVTVVREDGKGTVDRTGEILDYRAGVLTLRLPGNQELQIPSERVRKIDTPLGDDHRNADQLMAEGRFADALLGYREAVNKEQRAWMRRTILARIVRCHQYQHQLVSAGEAFLIIARSDPQTRLYEVIPLAWSPQQPDINLINRARAWCEASDPTAQLLGASWLLSGSERSKALATLERLVQQPKPIGLLAQCQRWRTQVVTASLGDLDTWQSQISSLPASLQAGPSFVLARGLAHVQEHQQAALTFMRIPILFPAERDLAAQALFQAGDQLQQAGLPREAREVYGELVNEYKGHQLVAAAQQRLEDFAAPP
jgi:tetratricopeptide (TPR) repeat protein